VQFGQRTALMGMLVEQNGHSLDVGSAGAGAGFARILLNHMTMTNNAKAMIKN
jgi:hypothetical protein